MLAGQKNDKKSATSLAIPRREAAIEEKDQQQQRFANLRQSPRFSPRYTATLQQQQLAAAKKNEGKSFLLSFGIPDHIAPAYVAKHFPSSAAYFPSTLTLDAEIPIAREAQSRFDALNARRAALPHFDEVRHANATDQRNGILQQRLYKLQKDDLRREVVLAKAKSIKAHDETASSFGIPSTIVPAEVAAHFPRTRQHFPNSSLSSMPIQREQQSRFDSLHARREALARHDESRRIAASQNWQANMRERQMKQREAGKQRLLKRERAMKLKASGGGGEKPAATSYAEIVAVPLKSSAPAAAPAAPSKIDRGVSISNTIMGKKTHTVISFGVPMTVTPSHVATHLPHNSLYFEDRDLVGANKNKRSYNMSVYNRNSKNIPLAEEQKIRFDSLWARRAMVGAFEHKRRQAALNRHSEAMIQRQQQIKNYNAVHATRAADARVKKDLQAMALLDAESQRQVEDIRRHDAFLAEKKAHVKEDRESHAAAFADKRAAMPEVNLLNNSIPSSERIKRDADGAINNQPAAVIVSNYPAIEILQHRELQQKSRAAAVSPTKMIANDVAAQENIFDYLSSSTNPRNYLGTLHVPTNVSFEELESHFPRAAAAMNAHGPNEAVIGGKQQQMQRGKSGKKSRSAAGAAAAPHARSDGKANEFDSADDSNLQRFAAVPIRRSHMALQDEERHAAAAARNDADLKAKVFGLWSDHQKWAKKVLVMKQKPVSASKELKGRSSEKVTAADERRAAILNARVKSLHEKDIQRRAKGTQAMKDKHTAQMAFGGGATAAAMIDPLAGLCLRSANESKSSRLDSYNWSADVDMAAKTLPPVPCNSPAAESASVMPPSNATTPLQLQQTQRAPSEASGGDKAMDTANAAGFAHHGDEMIKNERKGMEEAKSDSKGEGNNSQPTLVDKTAANDQLAGASAPAAAAAAQESFSEDANKAQQKPVEASSSSRGITPNNGTAAAAPPAVASSTNAPASNNNNSAPPVHSGQTPKREQKAKSRWMCC